MLMLITNHNRFLIITQMGIEIFSLTFNHKQFMDILFQNAMDALAYWVSFTSYQCIAV